MSNPIKGVRIGNYRITPLGLCTLAAVLLLVIAAVVLSVTNSSGEPDIMASRTGADSPTDPVQATAPPSSPTPSPTPEPPLRSATIRSLGEIAMQQNLLRAAVNENDFSFEAMFSEISDLMGAADYTVADVEGSMGAAGNYSGSGAMITPPSLISVLKNCGVDMLMLANDHALDGGISQLMTTMNNCAAVGMDYVGASVSEEEKNAPRIRSIGGINVAFLAYTETLGENAQTDGANEAPFIINLIAYSNAPKDIAAAREAGADVVVCYVNWGEMLNQEITENQLKIAQVLVNAGVDVIIGYNPHVIQPANWFETTDAAGNVHRTLCLGAPGNFLSDQRNQYSDSGIIFEFTIQETEYGRFAITAPKYVPTYVWRNELEDGKYDYRVMPVGRWLESEPEGMAYSDVQRMRQVWAEAQTIMGTEVAEIAAE